MADNPPVFPWLDVESATNGGSGMSLRDWFAGHIMNGDVASQSEYCGVLDNDTSDAALSNRAIFYYRMADIMLAVRSTPLSSMENRT